MLEVQNVSKTFKDKEVLAPLTLTVNRGDTAVFIGESGCGKTTLLKIIMGLVPSDTGQVIFEGMLINRNNLPFLKPLMGYVNQEGGLFPHLTAMENILLMSKYLRRVRDSIHYLETLIPMTKLDPACLARYPGELSGGQRQRVSLLRALILKPKLLLLDEPMGALDPLIRAALQDDLKKICKDLGMTTLLVTHDLGEAAFFADQMILMKEGRVVQQGLLREFLEQPSDSFVTSFIRAQRPFDMQTGGLLS